MSGSEAVGTSVVWENLRGFKGGKKGATRWEEEERREHGPLFSRLSCGLPPLFVFLSFLFFPTLFHASRVHRRPYFQCYMASQNKGKKEVPCSFRDAVSSRDSRKIRVLYEGDGSIDAEFG